MSTASDLPNLAAAAQDLADVAEFLHVYGSDESPYIGPGYGPGTVLTVLIMAMNDDEWKRVRAIVGAIAPITHVETVIHGDHVKEVVRRRFGCVLLEGWRRVVAPPPVVSGVSHRFGGSPDPSAA